MSLWLILVVIPAALGHICLIHPPQRGWLNISTPGSDSCFEPQGPCGKEASGPPSLTYYAGSTISVTFQQNLNHYNPGWPGKIKVSLSLWPESGSSFTELREVNDYFPHFQAMQTNFTIQIQLPSTLPASRYVLQVIYEPNKPTEPHFHQCSDIAIVEDPHIMEYSGATQYPFLAFAQKRARPEDVDSITQLYTTCATSSGQPTGKLIPFARTPENIVPVDRVAAIPYYTYYAVYLSRNVSRGPNSPADILTMVSKTGEVTLKQLTPALSDTTIQQIDALVGTTVYNSYLLAIGRRPKGGDPDSGVYEFSLIAISSDGSWISLDSKAYSTGTYVNFMGVSPLTTDPDSVGYAFTFVAGNENSIRRLDAELVRVTYMTMSNSVYYDVVKQNYTDYTITGLFPQNLWIAGEFGQPFFSISPGLVQTPNTPANFTFVQIDPRNGSTTKVVSIQSIYPTLFNYAGHVAGYQSISTRYDFSTPFRFIAPFVFRAPEFNYLAYVNSTTGMASPVLPLHIDGEYDIALKSPIVLKGPWPQCP